MAKRREELEMPDIGIGLQDLAKAVGSKITRGYCNMVIAGRDPSSTSAGSEIASAQARKKLKKEDDESGPSSWSLLCQNIITTEPTPIIYNKRLDLLRKPHVPVLCKCINPIIDRFIHIETSRLGSMKCNTKDWIIQYLTRSKMVQDSQLLGLQQPAVYLIAYDEFCRRFARQLKDTPAEKWPSVFKGYCLEGESVAKWPIAILQPLNFQGFQAISYITGDNVMDDRVKLSFQGAATDEQKLQVTEVVSFEQEKPELVEEKQDMVEEQPESEEEQSTSKEMFLVWFTGTSHYSFEMHSNPNLKHFNSQSEQVWSRVFATTHFQLIKQDVTEMVQLYNKWHRLFLTDIKNEERRLLMHRFARRMKAFGDNELYIIVKLKQVNDQRTILVKGLQTGSLIWAPAEQFQVCYTLPQFSEEELLYLYLLERVQQEYREHTICRLLLADFYRQETDLKRVLKDYFPSKQKTLPLRCFDCHYILADLPTVQCFFCGVYCHNRCLTETTSKNYIAIGEERLWCCVECLPCSVCFCRISNPLVCRQCKSRFHRQCGQTRDKLSEQSLYECEDCLACDMCDKKLKNCKEGYVLVGDKIHCDECHIITGDYCRVCMKSWNKESKHEWFQCNGCEGWVHQLCDQELLRPHHKYFEQEHSEYLCPKCRSVKRRQYLKVVIEVLAKFDEYSFFVDPAYDTLIDYLDIIEHPMSFKKMTERCMAGLYDTDSRQKIEQDFNLIVSNALKYNMPKDLPHKSAKIMKIMGDTALDHFQQFMKLTDMQVISSKDIRQRMIIRQRDLFRQIYNHYLELLLNRGNFKSRVVVRNKSTAELTDVLYFKHSEFLRRFKNSTIDMVYTREPPTIDHLFSLPKSATGSRRMSATRAVCYYHNQPDVVTTCNICCQAFCCVDKCFLHKVCQTCKTKGCRCSSWGCGCRGGYAPRDLQNPLLRQYGTDILTLTQMYTYCLKCTLTNIKDRQCKYCSKLCSYSYTQCKKCQKRFHKSCCRNIFIGLFCYECQRLPDNQNKLKQQIKQETRKRLFKMIRVEKYVPHVLRCYFQEGVRMDTHQVRQLILQNYDTVEEHLDQLECYENSLSQIEKVKIKEQKSRLMSQAVGKYLSELRSPLRLEDSSVLVTEMQFAVVGPEGHNSYRQHSQRQIYEKYFKGEKDPLEEADQVLEGSIEPASKVSFCFFEQPLENVPTEDAVMIQSFNHKSIMRSLYETTPLIRPKLTTATAAENRTNQIHDIKSNESSMKRIQDSRQTCRNLFLTFYYGLKQYPRFGSTSLIELGTNSIMVYKKWEARAGMLIKLFKLADKWYLRLDKQQFQLRDFEDLKYRLSRFRPFESMEEVGNFLGFNIRQDMKDSQTYIKFLQNNPLDADAFIQRKNKVMGFYDKVEHNQVQRKQLFFLGKRTKNSTPVNKRTTGQAYITLEELTRELDDQPPPETVVTKPMDPTREIFIAPSTIHKLGLFSRKDHPKNAVIIEYVGEILGQPIADIRQTQFHLGCYMFGVPKTAKDELKYPEDTVDEYTPHLPAKRDVIDATFRGNQARYLNHSCDPNCASKVQEYNGQPRILIYAIRDIKAFEQLTYDYQFKVSAGEKLACTCGSKNCQGRLN